METFKTLNDYQDEAFKTAQFPDIGNGLDEKMNRMIYPTMGLTGEAGEFSEKVKKLWRDKGGVLSDEDRELLKLELGDVLWYVAILADCMDMSLEEVAEANIEKLEKRKRDGKIGGSGDKR